MDFNQWLVLIVEDDLDSARVISEILTYYGIQRVQVAGSGDECLAMVDEVEPTIIIMDLSMPGLDGWQTLMELRANSDTATIPVVAVTAYYSAKVAQGAVQAGFEACFPKPLHLGSFMDTLSDIVG